MALGFRVQGLGLGLKREVFFFFFFFFYSGSQNMSASSTSSFWLCHGTLKRVYNSSCDSQWRPRPGGGDFLKSIIGLGRFF